VIVSLNEGEKLYSEAGAMMFISGDVGMNVEAPGGVKGALTRKVLSGESMFLATYSAHGAGAVGLTGPFPGSIRQHELDGEIICERDAYLGHVGDVTIESAFAKKAGMGLGGGGEGVVLQRLKGKGTVWLHGGGDFLDFDLVEGQTIVVDTGCMVMIEPTVKCDVKLQAGNVAMGVFGGEGFFHVHMTGPGTSRSRRCRSRAGRRRCWRPRTAGTRASAAGCSRRCSSNTRKGRTHMGLLDKAKAAAEQAVAKVQEGAEELQTKRALSSAYGELGKLAFDLADRGELSHPQLEEKIDEIRKLKAAEANGGGEAESVAPPASNQPPAMPT
jgi:uncharacterized protein (AIM24 family)